VHALADGMTMKEQGVSLVGALGVVFVVLKLCHVIDWSWWWVTLPFWGGAALVLAIFLVCIVGGGLLVLIGTLLEKL